MRIENVWQWEGRVNRATYFLVGIGVCVEVCRGLGRGYAAIPPAMELLNYWRPFGAITDCTR